MIRFSFYFELVVNIFLLFYILEETLRNDKVSLFWKATYPVLIVIPILFIFMYPLTIE